MTISFTPAASDYIKQRIAKENGVGFRLSVKKTGCSGYAYLPSVIAEVNLQDQQLELDNGVKVFMDVRWAHLLQQLQVDFVAENKTGISQRRLIFINPLEASRCGCGESFQIEASEKN